MSVQHCNTLQLLHPVAVLQNLLFMQLLQHIPWCVAVLQGIGAGQPQPKDLCWPAPLVVLPSGFDYWQVEVGNEFGG
jgi:hypothetical protein